MADRIVYSTDPGWNPEPEKPSKPKQNEPVRVEFRRWHKGSGLTLVERLQMHPEGKEELLRRFKKKFGAGGAVKQGRLELQGDRREAVEAELKALGYKVRRIGW